MYYDEGYDYIVRQRLKDKTVKAGDCLVLEKCRNKKGYVNVSYKGRQVLAHRLSYTLHTGSIPEGLFVCHTCDNPSCINPDHLFLGTNDENMQDMCAKDRSNRGSRHYSAVLNDELVLKLRKEYNKGDSWMDLEKKYGVNRGVLRPAILGMTWKHLPLSTGATV